jgi:putative transposase
VDYRIYDKARDGKTKNDHFRDLLDRAYARGFEPECVLFDSWYASLENLKAVRSYGWAWLTRLKRDRQVNPDGSGAVQVRQTGFEQHVTAGARGGPGLGDLLKIVAPYVGQKLAELAKQKARQLTADYIRRELVMAPFSEIQATTGDR